MRFSPSLILLSTSPGLIRSACGLGTFLDKECIVLAFKYIDIPALVVVCWDTSGIDFYPRADRSFRAGLNASLKPVLLSARSSGFVFVVRMGEQLLRRQPS